MSGLKQLRNRVRSITSTQKITKAMQVVSAAKLKKLKDQATQVNDFSDVLSKIMTNIMSNKDISDLSPKERPFFELEQKEGVKLLVVITSERGLCGSFNSTIIRQVKADLLQYKKEGQKIRLIIVGKKGYNALKTDYLDLIEESYNLENGNYECVAQIMKEKIVSLVEGGSIESCFVYYNKFKNAITQTMTKEQILPVLTIEEDINVKPFDFEGENLIHNVINLYLNGKINYAFLQSRAGEEGARMTAMDSSTKNAGDLIDKLTLKLNRSRQALITTELTEIISGVEAV